MHKSYGMFLSRIPLTTEGHGILTPTVWVKHESAVLREVARQQWTNAADSTDYQGSARDQSLGTVGRVSLWWDEKTLEIGMITENYECA